ncbi:MAG TPA: hypothetical protein VF399_08135 [bacterium]
MDAIEIIRDKVEKYGRRQSMADILALVLTAAGLAVIAASVALLFLKSPWFGLIGIVPFILYRRRRVIDRARELERCAGLEGELVNSLQLSRIAPDSREHYSSQLIHAYIEGSAQKARVIDSVGMVSHAGLKRALFFCLVAIVLGLLYPALMPSRFWFSLHHQAQYVVDPEHGSYDKNAEAVLTIEFLGPYVPQRVACVFTDPLAPGKKRETITVTDGIARQKITVQSQFTYHYEFAGMRTQEYAITAKAPLYLREIAFELDYPAYLDMTNDVKKTRILIAPAGTRVIMTGRASQPLRWARFEYSDTVIDCACARDSFNGAFAISKSSGARLFLTSASRATETIEIYAIPDLAPLVDVYYPAADINMPVDLIVPLGIRCSDDYELQSAILHYQFREDAQRSLKLKSHATEDTIEYEWDLSDLGMLPGDRMSYYVTVRDNAGNQTKSRTYTVYFPTMEQIYQDVTDQENMLQGDIREMSNQQAKESREVERIKDKLMKQRELDWADKERLKEMMTREETFVKKLDEWQEELRQTIEQLDNGILLDQESIERLKEITRILNEIAPEEMRSALENLERELAKNPEDIKKALENLKDAQDEFTRSLERTLEILKRYQQEEKLRELAQQAQDLARQAENIPPGSDTAQTVRDKVKELQQKIDSLAAEIGKLAESEGLEQNIKDELNILSQKAGDISSSDQPPGKTEQDLNKLAADLQRLYEQLTQGRSAKLRKNILETIHQLIDISKQEESLTVMKDIDPDMQDQIIDATRTIADSMYGQQKKSLYVMPGTGKKIARAIKEMEQARTKGSLRQSGRENARSAMAQLNIACLELMEGLDKGSEGSSSTGMDQFLQNLSSIAQGQMSLGQSMMSLFPLPMAGPNAEMMSQMRSLAGKQRELRQALESLGNESGTGQLDQGVLDNMASEMKELEQALYQYKLDRTLIERQQILISRLLDAQKSIRQEDFRKERKSVTGEDMIRLSPGALPDRLGIDELRERLLRALKEPYPEEYEIYIREYFKTLLEEK